MTIKQQDRVKINDKKSKGYILPTILALSVIMMTTLATSLSFTTAIRVSIKKQGYDRLILQAKQAGIAYAKACVEMDPSNADKWSADDPLTPATKCDGTAISGEIIDCLSNDGIEMGACAVINDEANNYRTSFAVSFVELDSNNKITNIDVEGGLGFTSKSSKKVWKKQTNKGGYKSDYIKKPLSWKKVSSGANHTCAIGSDDKAYCWGKGSDDLLGDGKEYGSYIPMQVGKSGELKDKNITSISSGMYRTCAVSDDSNLYCWGLSYDGGPARVSSGDLGGGLVKSVSVGSAHTCAIDISGVAYCWGSNSHGQLGNGGLVDSDTPSKVVQSEVKFTSITVGDNHTCALSADGDAYCWGYNNYGQLGDSTYYEKLVPTNISNSGELNTKNIKSISTGLKSNSTCAVATDLSFGDQVYCWGDNYYGQLGNGTVSKSNIPTAVHKSGFLANNVIKSVSVGETSTCAVGNDTSNSSAVYCWGNNKNGAVGVLYDEAVTGQKYKYPEAVRMDNKSILSLSSGSRHACAIDINNQMHCWGDDHSDGPDNYGVLGNNDSKLSFSPVDVSKKGVLSNKTIDYVEIGGYGHTCAIDDSGKLYCWGRNNKGQLGDNTRITSRVPVEVYVGTSDDPGILFDEKVKSVSISRVNDSTCALTESGKVGCWGANDKGQLGDGTKIDKLVPTSIKMDGILDGLSIKDISMGGEFTCAIASDNKAYCWGQNDEKQLGNENSDLTLSVEPVAVDGNDVLDSKTLVSISSGRKHACVLDSQGDAYCWGQNVFMGVLGNTSIVNSATSLPVKVDAGVFATGKNIKAIYAGDAYTCAINSDDNQAYCWGYNNYGQLGDGGTQNTSTPQKVYADIISEKVVKSMSINAHNGCLITLDDKVYCWGDNSHGQLGINAEPSADASSGLVQVFGGSDVKNETIDNVSVGLYSNCALTGGKVYCRGYNKYGQLGNNSTIDSLLPTSIFTSLTYLQKFEFYR